MGISTYTPTQYAGKKPPAVDFTNAGAGQYIASSMPDSLKALVQPSGTDQANSFRPVQALYTGEVANRSQGNDVGYSPEWMSESAKVLQSNSDRQLQDQLRKSAGNLSASGLGGNPRAYQATSGIIQRDNNQNLQNSLSALNIQNMQAKQQEKDVNTGRLGALNNQNFGQENTGANFDLTQWMDQNQLGLSATALNNQAEEYKQQQNDAMINSLIQGAGQAAGAYFTGGASLAAQAGTGIAPGESASALSNPYGTNYSSLTQPLAKTKLTY